MTSGGHDPGVPSELRDRLRDWFIDEMSTTDAEVPVAPPRQHERLPVHPTGPRRWFIAANAALILTAVAGLIVLTGRGVEQSGSPVSPPAAAEPTISVTRPPVPVDVGGLLSSACARWREAAEPLPFGAEVSDVDRVAGAVDDALVDIEASLSASPQPTASFEAIQRTLDDTSHPNP